MSGLEGIRIGHWSDAHALTGCTVVLPPAGTIASAFVAGGAPATHETDLLQPGMKIQEVHGLVLTGGSAFGLAAAGGVMRWLEERGIGYDAGVAHVPIVPAAAIFDLWPGDASVRPGAAEGYAACEAATEEPTPEGNIGAGTGSSVGKTAGPAAATKGGLGWARLDAGGTAVAALAVVNAVGDVFGEDGKVIAGARAPASEFSPWSPPSTTLACIVTNADLTKEQAHRIARMGVAGLARAIRPVNTMFDGDAVFVLATRTQSAHPDVVGSLASDAVAAAVRRGVLAAESVEGLPACSSAEGVPYAG